MENLSIGQDSFEEYDNGGGTMDLPAYSGHAHLDTLVSIGTGEQERTDSYPNAFNVGGLKEAYLSFMKALDTESSWNDFQAKTTSGISRHYRLNVPIIGSYVSLDDWSQMQRLERSVRECYSTSIDRLNALQDVASRLTASLLFFEPDAHSASRLQPQDRFSRIQGQLWCRLARDTPPLRALVDRISSFSILEDNPRSVPSRFVPITLKEGWKSEIRTEGRHLALPITLKTTEPESVLTLAVSLRDVSVPGDPLGHNEKVRRFPISGFPVKFKDIKAKIVA